MPPCFSFAYANEKKKHRFFFWQVPKKNLPTGFPLCSYPYHTSPSNPLYIWYSDTCRRSFPLQFSHTFPIFFFSWFSLCLPFPASFSDRFADILISHCHVCCSSLPLIFRIHSTLLWQSDIHDPYVIYFSSFSAHMTYHITYLHISSRFHTHIHIWNYNLI